MRTVEPMRLALIDDHELVREGLRALLEEKGDGDVDVVYSGESPADAVGTGATVALLDVDLGPGSDPVATSTRLLSDAGAKLPTESWLGNSMRARVFAFGQSSTARRVAL